MMGHSRGLGQFLASYRYNSLLKRAFRTIFVGVALPLMVVIVAIYLFSQTFLNREIEVANLRALDTLENITNSFVDGAMTASMRISLDSDVSAQLLSGKPQLYADFERVRRVITLLEFSRRDAYADSVYLYDPISDYLITNAAYASRMAFTTDMSFLDHLPDADREGLFWVRRKMQSQIMPSSAEGLSLFRRIGTESTRGYTVIDIYDGTLLNLFGGTYGESGQGTIAFIDEAGTLLFDASGRNQSDDVGTAFGADAGQQIGESARGVFPVEYAGEHSIASFTRMQNGWTLIRIVPYLAYAGSLVALRTFVFASLALGLLISLAVAAVLASRLYRPIAEIANFIDRQEPGSDRTTDNELNYILLHLVSLYDENKLLEQDKLDRYAALRSAQAQSLQAQITPHFLHNTLQAIGFMVLKSTKNENDPALQALVMLADIARATMEDNTTSATLASELAYVDKYIALQKLRYRDALTYSVSIHASFMAARVPRMCLQPLVENAIEHALKSTEGRGHIEILATVHGDALVISVDDDGASMDEDSMRALNEAFASGDEPFVRHIGLRNVNLRTRLLFGEAYGVSLARSPKGGISQSIRLPIPDQPHIS